MKDILQPVVRKFLPFAKKRMGFDDAPSIYLRTDTENAKSIFGKTAHYDPGNKSIVLYVHNRHPKDVLRSLSHELVHHAQNCRGEFDNTGDLEEGYAQKNPHLRDMEEEAYRVGNLVFRDFEDMMKEKTIYREFLEKGETLDMSHEKWRNKELGTLLSESWGFGFDLSRLSEAQEAEQDPDPESEEAEKDDKEQPEEQRVDISDEIKEGMCSGKRDAKNKCPGCPKCKPMEEGEEPIEEAKEEKSEEEEDEDIAARTPPRDKENKADFLPKPVRDKINAKSKMEETKLRAYIRKLIQESLKEG